MLILEQRRDAPENASGDMLTGRAVRLLAQLGAIESMPQAQSVRGTRIHMRGHKFRDFHYPSGSEGLVVPHHVMGSALSRRAVTAGAEKWTGAEVTELVFDGAQVVGVRVSRAGSEITLRAPVVVAADGPQSRLARAAGLATGESDVLGIAVRANFTDVRCEPGLQEIFLPLVDAGEQQLVPSFGWIHHMGGTEANVGVGLYEPSYAGVLDRIFAEFVEGLRAERGGLRRRGRLDSAPLRFDFAPDRCVGPGIVLVGAAAGLTSPFTGEGISYALESGAIAADVVDRSLRQCYNRPDLLDYSIRLEHAYSGYFDAGRASTHRHRLMWHVLESTFDSDRPPFVMCRQWALLSDGAGALRSSGVIDDVAALIAPGTNVRADILGVGETMLSAVRGEWPFLARLAMTESGDPGVPFRPALLVLLCSYFGDSERRQIIDCAAAVELGCAAAVVQLGVESDARHANWGNKFAILVADLLLAKAMQLSARTGSDVLEAMTSAITDACTGQLLETEQARNVALETSERLRIVALKSNMMFQLPCRLGALVSGAGTEVATAVGEYGRNLALAYRLIDEVLEFAATRPLPGTQFADVLTYPMLVALERDRTGLLAPLLTNGPSPEDFADIYAIVHETGALDATRARARRHADRAIGAISALPAGPARTSMAALARYAITREAPSPPDLTSVLDSVGRADSASAQANLP